MAADRGVTPSSDGGAKPQTSQQQSPTTSAASANAGAVSPKSRSRKLSKARRKHSSDYGDRDSGAEDSFGGVNASSEFLKRSKEKLSSLFSKTKYSPVVHQVKSTAVVVSKKALKGAHHLKNIFVAPLVDVQSFQAPNFPKDKSEKAFLKAALNNNFVFANLSKKQFKTMIDAFELIDVKMNTTVIKQGDDGDYFYVIQEGKVRFEVNEQPVGTAETGNCFGELALLYTCPRAASAIAEIPTSLYRVDQKTFRYILQSQTLQSEQDKMRLLQNVSFLQTLDPSDIQKLIHTMVPRFFEEGEVLVQKGDANDMMFYILQEGAICVTDITVGSRNYEDTVLETPGDYFGERALITNEPRSANCIAKTKGMVLSIDKDTFEKVIGNFAKLTMKSEDKRKLAAIKLIQMTNLPPQTLSTLASKIADQTLEPSTRLMESGCETRAALYIVREGKIELKHTDGSLHIIDPGGYFGEDLLEIDIGGVKRFSRVKAGYSATVVSTTNAVVGVLGIDEVRRVIDTTKLGRNTGGIFVDGSETSTQQESKEADVEEKPTGISFEMLHKHAILGSGTFGQVWLVSASKDGKSENNDKKKDDALIPYALKIQSKLELLENHQARSVVREKNLMQQLQHHPFIIDLINTYQDPDYLYMLLGIVQGGELLSVIHTPLRDGVREWEARFYAAVVLEGLTHMHRNLIIYRDLKPENVLIDAQGYPVIVDLGFAKYVPTKTYTLCGTPLYIAPEVILNRGHDKGADHWSYGVLIHEMIAGQTPFFQDGMDQMALFRAICNAEYRFPPPGVLSQQVEDLLKRLFVLDPAQRLGSLAAGIDEIYAHEWYDSINFSDIRHKEAKAPWVPDINDPLDSSNFENWDHLQDKTLAKRPPLPPQYQSVFEEF